VRLGTDASPTRLFDLFRGPHLTVLTFSAQHADAAAHATRGLADHLRVCTVIAPGLRPVTGATVLFDPEGRIRRAYGARDSTLIVVRPDGYIGLIAHRPTDHTLRDYLAQAHLRPLPTAPSHASASR
ncbi:hypothetical protein AB0J28_38850, partial [Streptosporangium canum]